MMAHARSDSPLGNSARGSPLSPHRMNGPVKKPTGSSLHYLPPQGQESGDRSLGSPGTEKRGGSGGRRTSAGSRPPVLQRADSASGRRSMTPTKQVALQAVRKKEESEVSFGDFDWKAYEALEQERLRQEETELAQEMADMSVQGHPLLGGSSHHKKTKGNQAAGKDSEGTSSNGNNSNYKSEKPDPPVADDGDNADDEGEDDDDEDDEEDNKAPNQLIMEFLQCVMEQDYLNAAKLCQMILLYEPNHPEALMFKPLIEEKMQLDAEASSEESDDEDDDEDEDDDDDDDDDEESSSEESEESDADEDGVKPDSGIASASEDMGGHRH